MSKKHYADRNLKFETLQLHVGQETPDPVTDARAVPIYLTSSYVFHNSEHAADRFGLRDAGNIYGRLTNPTEDVFERRIAALEGGVAALAVGSGAAALTYAFQAVAHAGDHIVAAKNIYGGTYNLLAHTLPDYGIEATFVDPFDYDGIKAAIKENTKAIEIETLVNPNSEVVDIEKIANIAHEAGIPLIVDNTFATPYLVRPIEYGADIVVHSATKFIGGHGTTIGGVIIMMLRNICDNLCVTFENHIQSASNMTVLYDIKDLDNEGQQQNSNSSTSTDGFIQYYQGDYANVPYGSSNLAKCGCGPTSFAMVATHISVREITPADAIAWCGNSYYVSGAGTSWTYFSAAARHFNLNCTVTTSISIDEVANALHSGALVISSHRRGLFTNGGHYIVLSGIDSDDNITVKDPNKNNAVNKGYNNRKFTKSEINASAKNYWIFRY